MQPATLFDLTGKTALVTGGGSGIGAAMAHALAGSGANVILAARREGQLAEAAQRLNAAGGEVRYVCADLTRQPDIAALAEQSGPVDILVNAAGSAVGPAPESAVLFDASPRARHGATGLGTHHKHRLAPVVARL